MTRPSVRLRLALLIGLTGLLGGAAMLAAAYGATSQAINDAPVTPTVAVTPSVRSEPEAGEFKARQAAAEQLIRERLRTVTLRPLMRRGLLVVGVVAVASFAGGWYAAGFMLLPLRRITETTRRVADRSLHERIALTRVRDEWWDLGSTINSMLSRLDVAFAAQRQFVGNASHELKTPLAINQTLLDVAMSRPDAPPELVRLGETMLEVNARHERLVDGLLALARAEHGVPDPRPIGLDDVIEGMLAHVRPEAERLKVRIDVEASPVVIPGDRILLDRLVLNLLQNAVRHNVNGGWVRLTVGPVDAYARLTVANTGPILAASRVPQLFEPFQRATNRVGSARGSGLGLSIVRSVVRAHGGTVDAVARDGGGLDITVTIPRHRP